MTGGLEMGREGDHCFGEVLLAGRKGREEGKRRARLQERMAAIQKWLASCNISYSMAQKAPGGGCWMLDIGRNTGGITISRSVQHRNRTAP